MSTLTQYLDDSRLALHRFSSFLPEMLNSALKWAQFEHLMADPEPFKGQLSRLAFGEFVCDTGSYSRSVFARALYPAPEPRSLSHQLNRSRAVDAALNYIAAHYNEVTRVS